MFEFCCHILSKDRSIKHSFTPANDRSIQQLCQLYHPLDILCNLHEFGLCIIFFISLTSHHTLYNLSPFSLFLSVSFTSPNRYSLTTGTSRLPAQPAVGNLATMRLHKTISRQICRRGVGNNPYYGYLAEKQLHLKSVIVKIFSFILKRLATLYKDEYVAKNINFPSN